eukprot:13891806-Heterocapsa_arctica.AAC.1
MCPGRTSDHRRRSRSQCGSLEQRARAAACCSQLCLRAPLTPGAMSLPPSEPLMAPMTPASAQRRAPRKP